MHDIAVIDNDRQPSAQTAVEALVSAGYPLPVRYRHEPEPGLAAARNRALDEAGGADILVFIDDDELAEPGWPAGLIEVMQASGAALVGGPVRTRFHQDPPSWVVSGRFFERPEPANGTPQEWLRSGNLAIDLGQIGAHRLRFDQQFAFTGGEDSDFSRRARAHGLALSWSASAAVTELVGPERTTVAWLTRRERRAATSWVRSEIAGCPTLSRRLLVAGRGAVRLAQGAGLTAAGALTGRRDRLVWGLMRLARGVGALQGLVTGAGSTYGR